MSEWSLLDVLPEAERRRLVAASRRRRFARNEVFFHEGDPGDALHLVSQGHVAIRIHTPFGDVATVRLLRPGEFFGELAIISPGPRNATATRSTAPRRSRSPVSSSKSCSCSTNRLRR